MLATKSVTSSTVLVAFFVVLKVACIFYIQRYMSGFHQRQYSFIGDDYPLAWPISEPAPVLVAVEPTTHYQMNGTEADEEWAAMFPNRGIVYLGERSRPFSISMVHQLRCLDILRAATASAQGLDEATRSSDLSRHCLNYLRQALLCRSDITLDSVLGKPANAYPDTYQCRDWDHVYREMRRNQAEHLL
ncbi:hypothetical protein DENSPDRAFT_928915 [Dentipellis sp. KUC8613]|nr:hypothetical protein DENSPDRAFT_928915 [Dentipellis sp. KUC8613]